MLMASTRFQEFSSLIFLLTVLILPVFSNAFQYLENLQGCQKGDRVEGLHQLKQYLNRFGYLNIQNLESNSDENDDFFDESLEYAIKTYQLNYHIKPTGALDSQTVSTMRLPRCGVSDIKRDGTSRMRSGQKKMYHQQKLIHTVSHYKFFDDNPKWPADKTDLSYIFTTQGPADAPGAIARAFNKWATASGHFTFKETKDNATADIRIGFYSRDHGDGATFDGPYGVLAHAAPPPSGDFHLDADEQWSIGPVPDHIDLETVALHEIGHLLGLDHSSVQDAIMFPSVSGGAVKELHGDDVQGIKELYSKP